MVLSGRRGPGAQLGVGLSSAAIWRNRRLRAGAAKRAHAPLSVTRAAILSSRRRMVANSALASACALGIASRTARTGEDAREQDLGQRVNHPRRVTAIGDHGGELPGDPHPSRRRGEQHHATVRRQAPAIERGGELLAPDGWKRERQYPIVGHGGCGRLDGVDGVGFSTQILRHIKELRHTRQQLKPAVVNKTS